MIISIAWTLGIAFALAALDQYRFERLIGANAVVCAAIAALGRTRLGYHGRAARPTWTVVLPIALAVLGLWRFLPASEYVIGGKDPGTYINEGIQVAQRGGLTIHDPVVAAVPPPLRDLFFPYHHEEAYYGTRFMGFFLRNPDTGTVTGQFPHIFPISIAIGYGIAGLTGARSAVSIWGVLGLLAVYVAGTRVAGRAAGFAAAVLLALHVVEVWYARYPNAEMAMQACVFALLAAFAYAHEGEDRFFAPVAAALVALLVFLGLRLRSSLAHSASRSSRASPPDSGARKPLPRAADRRGRPRALVLARPMRP